jgi:nitrite reductase/ring-hydroxylating ferredoxin subunit/ketosteroid isomerase-like protein
MSIHDERAGSPVEESGEYPAGKWVVVGPVADIVKRKKVVVETDGRQILIIAHEGQFFAFDNICMHRQRELSKGVILNGKLVCPGHQWAFALDTGWEAVKQECQPTHPVRLTDESVEVFVAAISPASTDNRSVRTWIDDWGAEVAAVDLAAARLRFASDVSAFGTHADVVIGRDNLETEQWSQVWPAIEDFRFVTDEMQILTSPDGLQAVAVVGWTSIGIDRDGHRFDRPGRATVVLARASIDEPWLGMHTHFSLGRDVPQSTHGARPSIH